tara:strand:+ start:173 stop:556 length:384 start_codon:yes stop_codon:yes gene_type:complete
MSNQNKESWLLARPGRSYKLNGVVIKEDRLKKVINEVVLDTIRPYGSSEHRQGQYKKIEKYDHLLDTISKNLRNLVEGVKSDLSYGYLTAADAEFLVNDHFERVMDSISYAGNAIIASIGKEDEEDY